MALRTSTKLRLGYVALAAADTWLAGSSRRAAQRARLVTKPLLMPTLAASLATDPRAASSPLRTSTLLAEGFGWGGDLALLGHSTEAFAAGAGSFGLGHVAYVAGFTGNRHSSARLRERPVARAAAVLAATAGPVMAAAAWRQERALGPAVLGYSTLLSAMLATSAHLDPSLPASARRLTLAGAALFTASDTLLASRKFLLTGAPERLESLVMATYTAAQLLLSEGAARA
jgi:uncharacterized membrane protein YhhN